MSSSNRQHEIDFFFLKIEKKLNKLRCCLNMGQKKNEMKGEYLQD